MSYLGSKAASGASQAIIALMPPHQTYIETHLGSGAVMLRKPPAATNIGIDIDPKAIANFQQEYTEHYTGEIKLHNSCAHDVLAQYQFSGQELVYSDPPYLWSTRTSCSRYDYEYTDDQHEALIALLKSINASVLLSGYPSELYNDLLADWNSTEFQVMTRGGVRTEKLWYNYEPDSRFWSSYAGRDFTHRQQIKRKASRWASNYKNMPPGERRAILSALLQVDSDPE